MGVKAFGFYVFASLALSCPRHNSYAVAFEVAPFSHRSLKTATKSARLPPPQKHQYDSGQGASALSLSGGQSESGLGGPTLPLREMFAEMLGTFLIVNIGCGTVCSSIYLSAQTGLWQIAAVWSIAVTVAIATTASVSGAHLNPAVSFALALLRPRDFGWGKLVPYVAAQLAGAVVAAGVNLMLFRESIAKYEAAKGFVRGSAASVDSAAAFGEYFR